MAFICSRRWSDALALGSSSLPSRVCLCGPAKVRYEAVLVLFAGDQEVYEALSECGGGVV
jgi:hypothetical protein